MADLRTTVTELVTGLGMLGYDDIGAALAARPVQMVSVSPEQWQLLTTAHEGGGLAESFDTAFANGRAFFQASDGLRGRMPQVIEWKGAQANPGDEALPIDLRIDHVFLISCKYLSKIVHNAAPSRVFDYSLRPGQSVRAVDWYDEVAPEEHQALYELTLQTCDVSGMPSKPSELTNVERRALRDTFPKRWPTEVEDAYARLATVVAHESARRWQLELATKREQEATLWRILRFGPAPYFVLGASHKDTLRLRIATPWDWRQHFTLQKFAVAAKPGGQPMVAWSAIVKNRHTAIASEIAGHIEIRWSHGRFGGKPEAKVYLDTPHHEIPGYFPLL